MGDARSRAAGYNIRWLLRAITRLGLRGLFCALSAVTAYALAMLQAMPTASNSLQTAVKPRRGALPWFKSTVFAVAV